MGSTSDRVSARARAVPVSPIRRMFDLTPRVPGAISLAVGEPGFATPPHIVEAGCQALHDGFTKYSPNPGYLELREAIARNAQRHARDLALVLEDIRAGCATSLRAIATELNDRGMLTRRGGRWHVSTVTNLLDRLVMRETACTSRG